MISTGCRVKLDATGNRGIFASQMTEKLLNTGIVRDGSTVRFKSGANSPTNENNLE